MPLAISFLPPSDSPAHCSAFFSFSIEKCAARLKYYTSEFYLLIGENQLYSRTTKLIMFIHYAIDFLNY